MVKTVITRERPDEEGDEVREEKEEEDFPKVFIGEVCSLQICFAKTFSTICRLPSCNSAVSSIIEPVAFSSRQPSTQS